MPGSRTGYRRTGRAVAVVDTDSCIQCGACVSSCPNDAITADGIVRIDAEKCSGCGACVQRCPVQAIRLA